MGSRVLLVAGLVVLVISIILFFVWNILDKIDEVTGNKERKRTEKLKQLNHGTSRVDRLSTRDIYSTIQNSQSPFSDSGNIPENSGLPNENVGINPANNVGNQQQTFKSSENVVNSAKNTSEDDEDDTPTGSMQSEQSIQPQDEVDGASDENPTGYMDGTPEESSSDIEEEATGLMEEIRDFYKSNEGSIKILEEQSSIFQ